MSKETTEAFSLLGTFINQGYASKDPVTGKIKFDLGKVIPVLLEMQPGLTGIGKYGEEMAAADIGQKEAIKSTLEAKFTELPADDEYDWATGLSGINNLISMIFRAGQKNGEAALAAKLKSGEVQLADL